MGHRTDKRKCEVCKPSLVENAVVKRGITLGIAGRLHGFVAVNARHRHKLLQKALEHKERSDSATANKWTRHEGGR
jgi:hypothetical protein